MKSKPSVLDDLGVIFGDPMTILEGNEKRLQVYEDQTAPLVEYYKLSKFHTNPAREHDCNHVRKKLILI